MKKTNFKNIRHIPHFYIIRSVESRLLSDYIDKNEGPFLDLGCGDGNFGRTLGLSEVYGIDIDEQALKANINNGYKEVLLADASKTSYPDSFFATVFSNCAVEHMDGLNDVLKEVGRVLKDKGKFIFTVPSNKFLQVLKDDEILKSVGLNRDGSIDKYNEFHHHVNILDLKEWKEKLEATGFKLLEYEYYLPGDIGGFVVRMDMLYTLEAPASKELLRKLGKKYKSISGLPFRLKCKRYIASPHSGEPGTHLIIKAKKV
jgi:SAM-dependent methyltransferase